MDLKNDPLRKHIGVLQIMQLTFVCRAIETIWLGPDVMKGNNLRNGLGDHLKAVSCREPERWSCTGCVARDECPYSNNFEKQTPKSYMIRPVFDRKEHYVPGDTFAFDLTLTGTGMADLYRFIKAIERLGSEEGIGRGRGRFHIFDVKPKSVYDASSFFKLRGGSGNPFLIRFISPYVPDEGTFRAYKSESSESSLFFSCFISNLLHRIVNIRNLFCNKNTYNRNIMSGPIGGCMNELKSIAETVSFKHSLSEDTRVRSSSSSGSEQKIVGLVGEMQIGGDLKRLIPYLKIGEVIGAGSSTTMGFGRYEVVRQLRQKMPRI